MPIVDYTPQTHLGPLTATRTILTTLLDYVQHARNLTTRNKFLASVRRVSKEHKLSPTALAKLVSLWTTILRHLGNGAEPLVLLDGIDSIHPLVNACLRHGSLEPLEDSQANFWDRKGNYRTRAPPGQSVAGGRALSRSLPPQAATSDGGDGESDGAGQEGDDDATQEGGGEDQEGSQPRFQTDEPLGFPLPEAVQGAPAVQGGAFGSSEDDSDDRSYGRPTKYVKDLNGGPVRSRRPVADDYNSLPQQRELSPVVFAAADRKSDFFAGLARDLARGGNYEVNLDLPAWVVECRAKERDFRLHTRKGKGSESIGYIVSHIDVRIDPKDIEKILCGEHLPLCDVHSYAPRSLFDAPEGFEALINSRFEAQRAKVRPLITLSAHDLIVAWDLVSQVEDQFFPLRTHDRLIFRGRLNPLLQGANTETVHRIGVWVDLVGREIASIGGTVSHWSQASNADPIYIEHVVVASTASRRAPPNSRKPGASHQRCNKYNRGSHNDEDEADCEFEHLCSGCGGRHSVLDCGRRNREGRKGNEGAGSGGGGSGEGNRAGAGAASRDAARGGHSRRR